MATIYSKRAINTKIKALVANEVRRILNPTIEIVGDNIPTYASPGSAGADIKADLWDIKEDFIKRGELIRNDDGTIEKIVLHANGQCLVPTNIFTSFPDIYEVQVRPRSGLALKTEITVTNSPGTIDSDYRNEWGIIIKNLGTEDFEIHQGDRIAQMVVCLICKPEFVRKDSIEELSGTDRGGGFGHSKV